MNPTQRLKAMVNNEPVDRIGVSGWVHMSLVDRNPRDFAKATINFTRYNEWDFVKVMYNGHYLAEAFGADILFSNDPTEWSGQVQRYPINHPKDFLKLRVLDPKKGVLAREIESTKRIIEHFKGEVPVLATIFTPLTWAQEITSSTRPGPIQAAMEYNPEELRKGLEIISETNIRFLEELINAGIDGIFYATQYASSELITKEQHAEFGRKYDLPALEFIKNKTWFNMLHIHHNRYLMFEEHIDYPVQAFNWEDKRGSDEERTSIAQVRALTDKIIIGGIEQHNDFYNADNNRESIKAVLKQRLLSSLEECGDKKFIFAPGCALPMDVNQYVFTLMKEVVDEVSYN
jgi:uroporphyrinogen decarboxylase